MIPPALSPGPEGTPVPAGLTVIRMSSISPQLAATGQVPATAFALSTEDKKQPIPRLSVWVIGLTTLEQAWVLVGASRERRAVLFLEVDAIRAMRADQPPPPHPGLDVEWEPATLPDGAGGRVPDDRAGADGHAGISRLDDGHGTKTQRKILRDDLARIASVRVLTEEEVERIAATPPA